VNNDITQMTCRSNGVVKKEDKLKDITDKEIKIIAILEIIEDVMWIEGRTMMINGNEVPLRCDTAGKSIEELTNQWKEWINYTQNDEAWKNGGHCGDCTKVPMTCFRCMCESRLETARKFMNYINNGEYQSY
jgi:DNA-directed RNA polymerase subunit N (RpoN/RPB10)